MADVRCIFPPSLLKKGEFGILIQFKCLLGSSQYERHPLPHSGGDDNRRPCSYTGVVDANGYNTMNHPSHLVTMEENRSKELSVVCERMGIRSISDYGLLWRLWVGVGRGLGKVSGLGNCVRERVLKK